ncbi:MAG: tetratricopeptide repeat protein [Cyanobacteria bacterium J06553_1]
MVSTQPTKQGVFSMRSIIGYATGSAASLLVASSWLPAQAVRAATGTIAAVTAQSSTESVSAYESLINQGQEQLDNRDFEAALATFSEATENAPSIPRGWVGKGEALYGLRQFDEAAIALTQATTLAPDYLYAWVWLGNAYDDAGQLEDSLAAYGKAIALDETNPMPYYHRGIALWYADQGARAEADLITVTEIMADFPRGWMWLGRTLQQQDKYNEALAAYNQSVSLDPTLPEALFGQGTVLLELERYSEATEPFDAFLEQRPNSAIGWFYHGNSLFGKEQYEAALTSYDRSLEITEESEGAWYNRGLVLANMDRYEEAIESFNRVLSINPDNTGAQQQIEALEAVDESTVPGAIS